VQSFQNEGLIDSVCNEGIETLALFGELTQSLAVTTGSSATEAELRPLVEAWIGEIAQTAVISSPIGTQPWPSNRAS
jgi:hypothetical protein